eukprot:768328-Hanusia_phi.AAC.5
MGEGRAHNPLMVLLVLSSVGIECSISSTIDEIRRPHLVVQRLYQQALHAGSVKGDFGVAKHFEEALRDKLEQVPLLNEAENVEAIGDGVLVRFRGMIQNIMSMEFYMKTVKTKDETNRRQGRPVNGHADIKTRETEWVKKDLSANAPALPLRFEEEGEETERKQRISGKRNFEPRQGEGYEGASKGRNAFQAAEVDDVERAEEKRSMRHKENITSTTSNQTIKANTIFALRIGNRSSLLFPTGFTWEQAHELVASDLKEHPDWRIEEATAEEIEQAQENIPTLMTEDEFERKYDMFPKNVKDPKKDKKKKKHDELHWAFGHEQFGRTSQEKGGYNPGRQYLMKLYDVNRKDLELLDVVEFVGILSFDAVSTVFKEDLKPEYRGLDDEIFSLNMIPTRLSSFLSSPHLSAVSC